MQHLVISYDIACQRRRVRVAQLLLDHGERVQESVYELRLRVGEWPALVRQLNQLIDPVADQWRVWPLCTADSADALELGVACAHPADQAIVV